MTINSPASMIFAMYLVVAEKQGATWDTLSRHDSERHPQGIHRAEGIHLPAAAVDAAHHGRRSRSAPSSVPTLEHDLGQRVPHPRGRRDGAAGAGVHAARRHRVRAVRRRRGPRRRTTSRRGISFFFNSHSDFFEEIAKYRAARRIWAQAMRDRFEREGRRGRGSCGSTRQTGRRARLTAQQPYNNVVRTALQALAAVLGGTQSLHTNSLDEALALPTDGDGDAGAAHAADHRARDRRDAASSIRSAGRISSRS